jgi:hypothetical protein
LYRVGGYFAPEGAEPRLVIMTLAHERFDEFRVGGVAAQEGNVLNGRF